MNDEETQELIKMHVAAVVPLMIKDLERVGGITDWHLEQVQGHALYIGEKGDTLQYYVSGQSGKAMHVLCEMLAVQAFIPGGVRFGTLHFTGYPVYEEIRA